jgi:subtilase family serine protease
MFPASLDNVTAVGGTSLALSNSGALNWETGWENGFSALLAPNAGEGASPDGGLASLDLGTGALDLAPAPPSWDPAPPGLFNGGAGGGVSVVYDQPTWQAGVVPDSIASSGGAPARAVPDVALLADPTTGLIIGFTDPDSNTYVEGPVGGTSLATPLFSAAMALAQQSTKKQFGFANPLLYKDRATAFRDVVPLLTQQAVAIPDVEVEVGATIVTTDIAINFGYPNLTISTTAGWDTVTGLGVPNGATFLTALAK